MRTTSTSRSASARLVLAGLLSLPISALLLAGPASAASGSPANPNAAASSSSTDAERGRDTAPGQQSTEQRPAAAGKKDAEPAPAQTAAARPAPKKDEPAPQQSAAAQPAPKKTESKPAPGSAGASGDTSSPQPLSQADTNGTGANPGETCTHNYCSTRDGSPSKNGSGTGAATGKPCAGCVGKADNKNPKGQAPDGSDANNGYECDGNNGIGKTNPAHTGCQTVVVAEQLPVEICPAGTPVGGTMSNGCKAETCPAGTPVGGTMSNGCTVETCPAGTPVGATMADGCTVPLAPPTTTTVTPLPAGVLSASTVRPGADPLVVPLATATPQLVAGPALNATAAAPAQVRPTALPFTGMELVWLLPAALVALALGVALVGLGRTRSALRV